MRSFWKIRIIACFAAGLLLAACFAAYADSTVYTEDVYWYTIGEDNSITITGCFGRDDVLNLPPLIAGRPVNHIAAGAFADCPAKVINLPDTIMDVEEGAFPPDANVNWRVNVSDQNGGSDENNPLKPGMPGTEDGTGNPKNRDAAVGNSAGNDADNPNGPAFRGEIPAETESGSAEGGAAMEVNIDDDAKDENTPDYMKKPEETSGTAATVADASDVKKDGNASAENNKDTAETSIEETAAETTVGEVQTVDGPGMVKESKPSAGMIIAIILGIAVILWFLWFFLIKRKKKDEKEKE